VQDAAMCDADCTALLQGAKQPGREPRWAAPPAENLPAHRAGVPCSRGPGKFRQRWPGTGRPPVPRRAPSAPDPAEFPVSFLLNRDSGPETGSHWTRRTANQSAVAETWRPHPATLPESPARSRGLGEGVHSRIGTGDRRFQTDDGHRVAFISVAEFGGPDSLPIRPIGNAGVSNSIRFARESDIAVSPPKR